MTAPIEEKIETIAKKIYGADGIEISPEAQSAIDRYKRQGIIHFLSTPSAQSKCSQNSAKMQSKCSQKSVKILLTFSQNGAKMQTKCSQNGVKIQSKFS